MQSKAFITVTLVRARPHFSFYPPIILCWQVSQSHLSTFTIQIKKKKKGSFACGFCRPRPWGSLALRKGTPVPAHSRALTPKLSPLTQPFPELKPVLVSGFLSTLGSKDKQKCECAIEQGAEWALMWVCTASVCFLSLLGALQVKRSLCYIFLLPISAQRMTMGVWREEMVTQVQNDMSNMY